LLDASKNCLNPLPLATQERFNLVHAGQRILFPTIDQLTQIVRLKVHHAQRIRGGFVLATKAARKKAKSARHLGLGLASNFTKILSGAKHHDIYLPLIAPVLFGYTP
jgi:hypothetical protein